MVSVSKTSKTATVVVAYNSVEMYHQVTIAYKSRASKKEIGPTLITLHSTNPVKLLDAIKTETGDTALAVNAMRLYMQQVALRCSELAAEVRTLAEPIKLLVKDLKKVKGVIEAKTEGD